jgi:hypothetical protein
MLEAASRDIASYKLTVEIASKAKRRLLEVIATDQEYRRYTCYSKESVVIDGETFFIKQ